MMDMATATRTMSRRLMTAIRITQVITATIMRTHYPKAFPV